MAETKWTPGPWFVDIEEDNEGEIDSLGNEVYASIRASHHLAADHIARVWNDGPHPVADAALLAAAPDLYTVLAHLVPFFDPDSLADARDDAVVRRDRAYWIEQAVAALAKARGEG